MSIFKSYPTAEQIADAYEAEWDRWACNKRGNVWEVTREGVVVMSATDKDAAEDAWGKLQREACGTAVLGVFPPEPKPDPIERRMMERSALRSARR